jgi:hypothetical protein
MATVSTESMFEIIILKEICHFKVIVTHLNIERVYQFAGMLCK